MESKINNSIYIIICIISLPNDADNLFATDYKVPCLPLPFYPSYKMQQREFAFSFGINNKHHAFVGECLQLKGIILGNEVATQFTHCNIIQRLCILAVAVPYPAAYILFKQSVFGCREFPCKQCLSCFYKRSFVKLLTPYLSSW